MYRGKPPTHPIKDQPVTQGPYSTQGSLTGCTRSMFTVQYFTKESGCAGDPQSLHIPQNYQAVVSSQLIKAGGIKLTIESFRIAEIKKTQKPNQMKHMHAIHQW